MLGKQGAVQLRNKPCYLVYNYLGVPGLLQATAMVQKARVEAMAANRHGDDEHLRWITASRSQPSDATAALVAGRCRLRS